MNNQTSEYPGNYDTVFGDSYRRALGNHSYNADFISHFYRCFFDQSEQIRNMFANTDMSAQKTMLHDSLEHLLEFYTTRKLTPQMQHLARVHGRKGRNVPANLYDLWLDSLMDAVKKFDPQFDDEIELAWRLVLIPGITFIKFVGEKDL